MWELIEGRAIFLFSFVAAAGFGTICLIERPTKPWGERTIERVAVGERQLGIWGGLFVIGDFRRLSGLAWARLSFAERMFYRKYSGWGRISKGEVALGERSVSTGSAQTRMSCRLSVPGRDS